MERLGDTGKGLVARFLSWYAPLFNAYTFVMARHQEREADAAAVEVCSSEGAGRALVRVSVLAHQANEDFWQVLPRRACKEAEPPANILGEFQRTLTGKHPAAGRWMTEALARPNSREDTHPCIRERLQNMGLPPDRFRIPPVPIAPSQAASKALLGAEETSIAEVLNQQWRQSIQQSWTDQYAYGQQQAQRRRGFEDRLDTLSRPELWELVEIIDLIEGPKASRPHLERLLLEDPKDPRACYCLGQLYISLPSEEKSGEALLLRAMELDRDAIIPASALLSDWHARHGREEEARRWDRNAYDRSEVENKAHAERQAIPKAKQLRPHGCSDLELDMLRQTLTGMPIVLRADLASVACEHLPERPYHLLAIHLKMPWYKPVNEEETGKLLQGIAEALNWKGAMTIIQTRGKHAALAKKVGKQKDARIYAAA
jgi:hypothetical protein